MGSGVSGFIGDFVSSASGQKKPDIDEEKYSNPAYDDIRQRMLAVIDSYIRDRGIEAFIPQDRRPYEYLSPEEQAQQREGQENPEANALEQQKELLETEKPQKPTAEPQEIDPLQQPRARLGEDRDGEMLQQLRLRQRLAERQSAQGAAQQGVTALPVQAEAPTPTFADYIRRGSF